MEKSDSEQVQSDSGSEDGFDPAEYTRQKNQNLRTVVLADIQFHKARSMLRDLKFAEVAAKKKQLKEKTCPEYLRRRQEILDEEKKQRLESLALFKLEQEALFHDNLARKEYVRTEENDNREAEKQKLIERLEAELAAKLKEEADLKNALTDWKDLNLKASGSPYGITRYESEKSFPEERKKAIILQGSDSRYPIDCDIPSTSGWSSQASSSAPTVASSESASTSGSVKKHQHKKGKKKNKKK